MTNFKLWFPLVILNFRRSYVDRIYFFILRKYINLFFKNDKPNIGLYNVLILQYFYAVLEWVLWFFFVYFIFFAISYFNRVDLCLNER